MNIEVLKHKNFKAIFEDCTFHKCVEEIVLCSWEDFEKIKKIFNKSKNDYIWRGQRKDWQLKSSFDRHPHYNSLSLLDKKKLEIRLLMYYSIISNVI